MTRQITSRVGMKGAENFPADVRTIQELLNKIPPASGGPKMPLILDGICGENTKRAIQDFQLRHFGWQLADGRVDPGRSTLAKLNELAKEDVPMGGRVCTLNFACPPDVGGLSFGSGTKGIAMKATVISVDDLNIMNAAFRSSRRSLWDARGDLLSVTRTLREKKPLSADQEKTWAIATQWLNLNQEVNRAACITHMEKAADLMLRNHNLKTSSGGDVVLTHVFGASYHAESNLNSPDLGLRCGDPFFRPDGPNCRRDVVTHEFFHMIGVEHGGCSFSGPTIRSTIVTPAQALNSADNLAQLVAGLRTFKVPNTDACTRTGD